MKVQLSSEVFAIISQNPVLRNLAFLDQAERELESGHIQESLDNIFQTLDSARETLSDADWHALAQYVRDNHPLGHSLYEDPMTKRALDKPRGYAGDAVMMDYLYGIHFSESAAADASPLGRQIYRYIQQRPAGQAVRFRREHIAGLIDTLAATRPNPSVLALAAGHLREAELSQALAEGRIARFVSLDADAESLREVEAGCAHLGVETIHGSVRHILARHINLGQFDFVYAAGLYDYLADRVAEALTARMFEMTKPGGEMLIPNFAPRVHDRAYMEAFMDWSLIYRDEKAMAALLGSIDPAEIESYRVYGDPTRSVVYLHVKKVA